MQINECKDETDILLLQVFSEYEYLIRNKDDRTRDLENELYNTKCSLLEEIKKRKLCEKHLSQARREIEQRDNIIEQLKKCKR